MARAGEIPSNLDILPGQSLKRKADDTGWEAVEAGAGLEGPPGPQGDPGPQGPPGTAPAPVYAQLANDTLAMAFATNDAVKLTVTANRTLTTTVPPAGHQRYLMVLTSGTTSRTITFGSGFKPVGTLATGTANARVFVIHWISDGTNLYEAGRTAAMAA